MKIELFVPGWPAPGGSKTRTKWGVRPANKRTAEWMNTVAYHAKNDYRGELLACPLKAYFVFTMPRPKNHYVSSDPAKGLKANAARYHTKTPDLTKLIRSTEDALKGIVFVDDCLITRTYGIKQYGENTGARIIIRTLTKEQA